MPQKKLIQQSPLIYSITDIFDESYCQQLINVSENNYEYETAKITVGHNQYQTDTTIRNNDRIVFDNQPLANELFEKTKPYLPDMIGMWVLKGLNERFRYYRYDIGQRFKPHFDGSFERSQREKSLLTLIFYLNNDFSGGETKFFEYDGWNSENKVLFEVKPEQGSALVFEHEQLHEGSIITAGKKYVLRTDVMYEAL